MPRNLCMDCLIGLLEMRRLDVIISVLLQICFLQRPASATCSSGDQTGIVVDGMTCADMLLLKSFECYDATTRQKCCVSCETIKTNTTGCEYGDKLNGCDAVLCSIYPQATVSKCCNSCPTAEPTTATAEHTTMAKATTTVEPTTTTANPTTTAEPTTTTTKPTTTAEPTTTTEPATTTAKLTTTAEPTTTTAELTTTTAESTSSLMKPTTTAKLTTPEPANTIGEFSTTNTEDNTNVSTTVNSTIDSVPTTDSSELLKTCGGIVAGASAFLLIICFAPLMIYVLMERRRRNQRAKDTRTQSTQTEQHLMVTLNNKQDELGYRENWNQRSMWLPEAHQPTDSRNTNRYLPHIKREPDFNRRNGRLSNVNYMYDNDFTGRNGYLPNVKRKPDFARRNVYLPYDNGPSDFAKWNGYVERRYHSADHVYM